MFETQDFQDKLAREVFAVASRYNLRVEGKTIVAYLQQIAVRNEPELMKREMRRLPFDRLGVDAALKGVRTIVTEAAGYALAAGRKDISLPDIAAAHRAKFCQIWPFCK